MTVNEAIEALQRIVINHGGGDLPLIAQEGSSGLSWDVHIGGEPSKVEEGNGEIFGELEEMELETPYVPIYL